MIGIPRAVEVCKRDVEKIHTHAVLGATCNVSKEHCLARLELGCIHVSSVQRSEGMRMFGPSPCRETRRQGGVPAVSSPTFEEVMNSWKR